MVALNVVGITANQNTITTMAPPATVDNGQTMYTTTIFCSTIFFVVEFSGRSKLHLGRSARNYVKVFFFSNAQCTDLKFRQSVAVVVVTVVVAAVVGVAHASQIVVSNGIPTPKLKTNAR